MSERKVSSEETLKSMKKIWVLWSDQESHADFYIFCNNSDRNIQILDYFIVYLPIS